VRKLHIYAREQVRHVWLIDPIARSLEIFRLDPPGWRLAGSYEGKDRARAEPFDAIELELEAFWLPEEPPARTPKRCPRSRTKKRARSR
jgi:Uma2 family endonuclease